MLVLKGPVSSWTSPAQQLNCNNGSEALPGQCYIHTNSMDCFACDDVLARKYEDLESHLTNVHQIKKNRGFVLMFFVMDKSELDDWNDMFTTRLEKLRMEEGTDQAVDEEDLAIIQSQIEFDDNSDDEEEDTANVGVKEELVAKGRTIIHTDGEKLLAEEQDKIECIELIDSDDDEEPESSSTTNTSTDVLETKPDVSIGMNKINLAEKFSSINVCKLCYHKCGDVERLRRHEEVVHKEDREQLNLTHFTLQDLKFPCDRCQLKFLTRKFLNFHSKLKHGIMVKESREDKVCEVCLRKVKYYSYKNHMKSHKEKKESCKLCYRKFREKRALEAHLKAFHQDEATYLTRDIREEDLTFSCHSCELRFVSENSAKYHIRIEHQVNKAKTQSGSPTFKCYFCEEKFHHPNERKSHCWEAHGKKDQILSATQVRCMVCEKVVSKSNLSQHKKSHLSMSTRFQKYKCEFCPGTVFRKISYKLHMRRLHNKKVKTSELSFKCKLCYIQFQSNGNLKTHLKTIHAKEVHFIDREITEEDLKFPCTKCADRFVSEDILKTHIRKHQNDEFEFLRDLSYDGNDNSYKCLLCYSQFSNFSELKTHVTSYHKEEINFVKEQPQDDDLIHDCPECDLKFVSSNSMIYHRIKVHYSSDGTYCKLCDTTMKSQNGTFLHTLHCHSKELEAFNEANKERKQSCSRCYKKFLTEGSLDYHKRKEHSISKKSNKKTKPKTVGEIKCGLCYKSFKKNIYRTQHVKNIHTSAEEREYISNGYTGDLKFECETCELKFLTASLLQKHVHEKHQAKTKTQTFKMLSFCNLCHFDLKRYSALEDHRRRVHTTTEEIATFNCEEVKYSSLKFDCSICKKKLISKSALKYHRQYVHRAKMMKDANQKISCEFCGKTFKWKNRGNLKSHIKSIHKINDYDVMEGTLEMENNESQPEDDFMSIFNM